ncbi:PTS sugar transporter subunit IIA [Companilactobacillus formosensis]|uniref:PTS sugar transporter subunit IIA n=1 Tax=Companilactobacillus formosensis TaxID=1617889 RepID=UPI000E65E661
MNKILIATHGHLASGLQSSLDILTGLGSKITVIDAYVDDHNYIFDIQKFINDLNGEKGVIFTDLIGGSVNQKVILELNNKKNIYLISGVNLPVVLSVLLETRPINEDVLNDIIQSSQVEMVSLKDNSIKETEEDFLA